MDSASKRVVIDTGELDSWPPSTNDTLAIAELFAKRQLLAQWRDRCIKLEQELEVAREQCMRLEQEIYVTNQEPLVVSSAHGNTNGDKVESVKAVNRVPYEVYERIFELYLNDTDHRDIRNLLLVCQYWNQIVMNTPLLFNRIDISFGGIVQQKHTRFATNYVNACHQRSGDHLLDVKVDLKSATPPEIYIRGVVYKQVKKIYGDPLPLNVWRKWASVNFPKETQSNILVSPNYLDPNLQSFIEALIGVDGQNMMRWRTLKLVLPEGDSHSKHSIIQLFAHSLPNLVDFTLENGQVIRVLRRDEIIERVFRGMKSLQRFIGRDGAPLRDIISNPSVLESLDTTIRFNWINLFAISEFKYLRTLRIARYYDEVITATGSYRLSSAPRIELPLLADFTLQGNLPAEALDLLDFPALHRLTLISNLRPLPMQFPRLNSSMPKELCWNVALGHMRDSNEGVIGGENERVTMVWEEDVLDRLFRELLGRYNSIESIEVPVCAYRSLKKVLEELQGEGLGVNLPCKVILHEDEFPELRKGDALR